MVQVNIHEAKTRLSKLLELALNGEEVIIAKRNKPIAKLVPINSLKSERKIGSAKGLITIGKDFDKPVGGFFG